MNQLLSIYKKRHTPGEHPFELQGVMGNIEAVLTTPTEFNERYLVLVGHPHSLHGGTMNNKVVTTLTRAFTALNIASIRYNFRGVGRSEGAYDAGIGESEDMLYMVEQWRALAPQVKIIFAGFSFGSYVAYRAALQSEPQLLISVAPPVGRFDFKENSLVNAPWIMLQGEEDDVVPYPLVEDFVKKAISPIDFLSFSGTGHFFHGQLLQLKTRLMDAVCQHIETP